MPFNFFRRLYAAYHMLGTNVVFSSCLAIYFANTAAVRGKVLAQVARALSSLRRTKGSNGNRIV